MNDPCNNQGAGHATSLTLTVICCLSPQEIVHTKNLFKHLVLYMSEIGKDLIDQIVEQFHKSVAEGSLRDFSANFLLKQCDPDFSKKYKNPALGWTSKYSAVRSIAAIAATYLTSISRL